MKKSRAIELLAPAKNKECGIEAIKHGADAVYIGAPKFGARVGATNSIEEIEELIKFAHCYFAKVYVTVNTIITDEQLVETQEMIWELYRIGVDALIIQDMGIKRLNLPPIPLHASTQADNRTVEKVRFMYEAGFNQVVLARELSLREIREIHDDVPQVKLESFIHGALCVSYSGQCYASYAMSGRSANRGECSQFCRLPFTLEDNKGAQVVEQKHLLSLKDLNRITDLEALLDAGVSSLKIEGRLKDSSYVKNVTAAYREALDAIFEKRGEYRKSSSGKVKLQFSPQLDKSFNRGFTSLFLHGRSRDVASFITPKSIGEEMGYVKDVRRNFIIVAGVKPFSNGDGLCFIDEDGKLQGFRVNRVEGNKLFIHEMPTIPLKTTVYRNYDHEFEKLLGTETSERKIALSFSLKESSGGFVLEALDEDGVRVEKEVELNKELAQRPQQAQIERNLQKLGNTPFECSQLSIELDKDWFIPASILTELRRTVVDELIEKRINVAPKEVYREGDSSFPYPEKRLTYLGNVINKRSRLFYHEHGVDEIEPGYEEKPLDEAVLMFTKHCLRYSLGICPVHQTKSEKYEEPFWLIAPDKERFKLQFDCKQCIMKVVGKNRFKD